MTMILVEGWKEERGVEEKHLMVRRPETTRLDKNYARQGGQPLPIGGSLDLVWVLPVNAKTILSYLNPSKNNNLLLRWAQNIPIRNHINRNVVRIFLCIVLNFIAFLACTSDCSKLLLFAGHLPISRRRQHLATRLTKLPICENNPSPFCYQPPPRSLLLSPGFSICSSDLKDTS